MLIHSAKNIYMYRFNSCSVDEESMLFSFVSTACLSLLQVLCVCARACVVHAVYMKVQDRHLAMKLLLFTSIFM